MRRIQLLAIVLAVPVVVWSGDPSAQSRKIEFDAQWGGDPAPLGWRTWVQVAVKEADGSLATNGICHVTIDNFGPEVVETNAYDLAKKNPFSVSATRFTPGFMRVEADGAVAGLPFEPSRLTPAVPKPADFEAYWRGEIVRAEREVPLDPRVKEEPDLSSSAVTVYTVSFATTEGRRLHALMTVPKGMRQWPAEVSVPGAGYGRHRIGARTDVVRFEFSVHAHDIFVRESQKKTVDKIIAANYHYYRAGWTGRREDVFFHPVIVGMVRALGWLRRQTFVEGDDIRYDGTSQGGGLGLALVALDGQISRATIFVPALAGLLDYKAGRQEGWPRLTTFLSPEELRKAESNAPYYDAVNFASMVTTPIRFAVGFADEICAPHCVYAAYNACPSKDKDIVHGIGMGHGVFPRIYDELGRWRATGAYEQKRPAPEKRCFRSKAVDAKIAEIVPKLKNRKLAWMFENCFPNTLDTTAHYRKDAKGDDEAFIYTGDIHAMWLRDSAAQVWPYLGLAKDDDDLRRLIRGVVRKQLELIRLDRYANAFNDKTPEEATKIDREQDGVRVLAGVCERKYELDSLCYPIRLAYGYWKATGDVSVFDADWTKTARLILNTMKEQQRKSGYRTPYFFARKAYRNESIDNSGWGRQTNPVGLIVSAFRPSDDATILPFLVPSNHMAVDVLGKAAEISRAVTKDAAFAGECEALRSEVSAALRKHALLVNPETGRRQWAFEVDGFGSALFMDDANVPSLIALPYFTDIPKDDPDYLATREFVWSKANPFFFEGTAITGIGGPHCEPNTVWPMSVILRALTATDDDDIRGCLETILRSDGGTGFIHESVSKDDPKCYSRSWFAWANTLFGELVYRLYEDGKLDLLNSVK